MNAPLNDAKTDAPASADPYAMMNNAVAACAQRSTQLHHLFNSAMTRHGKMLSNGMPIFLSIAKLDPDTLSQLFALQSAIADRFTEQNRQWVEGIEQITQEASQLKKANTLSKFMEQQCDLVGQWVTLMSTQTTNLATQLENVQVDLGYWISQKAEQES